MSDLPANGNGVRITNSEIYSKLQDVQREVLSTGQTVREVVLPKQADQDRRIDRLEFRFYAIIGGLAAAIIVANQAGLI
jgi:hypothetical protein